MIYLLFMSSSQYMTTDIVILFVGNQLYQNWIFWNNDKGNRIILYVYYWSRFLYHFSRTIVLRRVALMLSLLYGYRAITMMVTVLPKANPKYYCEPKLKTQGQILTFGTVLLRVVKLLSGFGLTMNGKHTYCGDFIFSGHTMTLVLSCLAMRECKWFYPTSQLLKKQISIIEAICVL